MSRIEIRCTECGSREVREFTFHGLEPPALAERCERCAAVPVAVVTIADDELTDDTRSAPHPAGGAYRVSEAAEALQRALLRRTLRHLADDAHAHWDRRVSIPTPGGAVLHARAFVDRKGGNSGIELFTPLGPRAAVDAGVLAAAHVLSNSLQGEVVLVARDLDLTRRTDLDTPAAPFYRQLSPADELEGDGFEARLAQACAEVDAAVAVLAIASKSASLEGGEIDERAFVPEVAEVGDLTDDAVTAAEVESLVCRLLRRFGLEVDDDAALPLRFRHGSATVSVSVEEEGAATFVVFRARLARHIDRSRALPFVADFNRAEEMGRFVLDDGAGVVYELALLGEDLDAGELLRGLVHAAEVADDRDDAIAELGGGSLGDGEAGDGGAGPVLAAGLGPAFEQLDGDGLLEDVDLNAGSAIGLVDRYVRQLGIYPTVDARGVRWIRSGSTQVGVWTRDAGRGAVVVFEAPVLYEVSPSEDIPAVLDGLNGQVRSGAFVYDPAAARVWFRDALFANDMDLSEFARAFLDAAQVADDHDDDLAARVGGRRTLDVVEEHAREAADHQLEALLAELQALEVPRRVGAAQALGGLTSARVIDGLTAALTDGSEDVVAAALRSLVAGPAVEALDHVVSNLCGVAVSQAYPAHGRRQALAGLELLASDQALPAVRTAMKDPESTVRGRAARAIGGLAERGVSSSEVADSLVRLLAEADPWVIQESARALAKLAQHTPDAVTPTDALARLAPMLEEAPADARPALYEALAQLGGGGADIAAAYATAADDPGARAGAARVLARSASSANPTHLTALAALAGDPSEEVREDAVAGLARIEGAAARKILIGILRDDEDVDVRRLALEELVARQGAREDAELREVLQAAADQSDDPLRKEDGEWGLHALDLSTGEGVGGASASVVRRALGADLPALLADLPSEARRRLFVDRAGAASVAGVLIRPLAASPTYPTDALGLIRLLKRLDDPQGVLGAVAAGATALAAAARRG